MCVNTYKIINIIVTKKSGKTAFQKILNYLLFQDFTTPDFARLEYKKFLLENRKESYGAVALLEKELDLERVNKQLDEVNLFIDAVTTHKATL